MGPDYDDDLLCEYPGCKRLTYTVPGVWSSPAYCAYHLYTLDE